MLCYELLRSLEKWRCGGVVSSLQIIDELDDRCLFLRRKGFHPGNQFFGSHRDSKYNARRKATIIRIHDGRFDFKPASPRQVQRNQRAWLGSPSWAII